MSLTGNHFKIQKQGNCMTLTNIILIGSSLSITLLFKKNQLSIFLFTFNFLIYLTTAILLFNDASFVTNWQRDKSCYNVSLYMCIVSVKKSECLQVSVHTLRQLCTDHMEFVVYFGSGMQLQKNCWGSDLGWGGLIEFGHSLLQFQAFMTGKIIILGV